MNILIFFVVLLIIVLAHEFGHFMAAKKFGIRVDEFGFGFPPRIFGKKFGETEYTFNLFPVGGFVKIFGEKADEESISGPGANRSFINKPKWVQAVVLSSGVFLNILLAWVLFISVFIIGVPYSVNDNIPKGGIIENSRLTIVEILPGSPAQKVGLKPGDAPTMLSSGDDILSNPTDAELKQFVLEHSSDQIMLTYRRGNATNIVQMIP